MKEIKVVIGAGFGDEGKGLMTDFFCNKTFKDKKVLNVRFNGSSQASHTVVTPDGKRHIFKQFGAGSFEENVHTYFPSTFVVNPIQFGEEYRVLKDKFNLKPIAILCKESNVILPFDALTNIFIETARGKEKHGSCGIGLWECVVRSQTEFQFKIIDLINTPEVIISRIKYIRDNYYKNRFKELNLILTPKEENLFFNDNIIKNFILDIQYMLENTFVKSTYDMIINLYDYQVYEGAQGLLLDWDNREYYPYLTASYTGLKNVVNLISKITDNYNLEVCYIMRSYLTRHGAGIFKTEASLEKLKYNLIEKTNITNEWQDNFRFGYLDKELIFTNIEKDVNKYVKDNNLNAKISLAITHLDETDDRILIKNQYCSVGYFMRKLEFNNIYLSRGETRNTITEIINKT